MSAPNLGWIFYREAFNVPDKNWFAKEYKELGTTQADKEEKTRRENFTKSILERLSPTYEITDASYAPILKIPVQQGGLQNFELTTTYPGLLIGSGYNHEASLFGELKLGFFFDHTTGLPVIPGSSVKGVLRSVFPGSIKDKRDVASKNQRRIFIEELIKEVNEKEKLQGANKLPELKADKNLIDKLEKEIFEGEYEEKNKEGKLIKKNRSMYQRDIFYESFILKSNHTPLEKQPTTAS